MDPKLGSQLESHLEEYARRRSAKSQIDGDLRGETPAKIPYGTAGFRGDASHIEHLFFNVGLIAGLRCLCVGANVGVMITASHNPVRDNGLKLIDSQGEMLESDWEHIVETVCNTTNTKRLLQKLEQLYISEHVDISRYLHHAPLVLIGMDSRPSSEALVALVKQGLDAWGSHVRYHDYGLVTTPALHYLVAESNKQSFEKISLNDYYEKLSKGYVHIVGRSLPKVLNNYKLDDLVIDCANGVGSETMRCLLKSDANFASFMENVKLINVGDGILNKSCGADYVKSMLLPPIGADEPHKRYAALDGDADRIVYFYLDQETEKLNLKLLDGDRILALYALYLRDVLKESGLEDSLSIGCIQTAYANGSSTEYLTKSLSLKVDCVDTGVKNLHKQAVNYDIGIYFEANGHGTIWFSDRAKESIITRQNEHPQLDNILKILNNYTGDAISDLLIVETILSHYDWDVQQWYQLYQDRPNVLSKLEIPDRSMIKTIDAGRTCIAPDGLQAAIDSIVSEFGLRSRAFVRASGTENVVRIYSEAESQESAEKLAAKVADQVTKFCN